MRWLSTPDGSKCLAFIPRCGSTAFGRAFLQAFYPEKLARMKDVKAPTGRPPFNAPQLMCNGVSQPRPDAEKYALIRDPIERFRSGFSRSGIASVDEAIRLLTENPATTNLHIRPQHLFLRYIDGVVTFKFPAGVAACAARLGVQPPPRENQSEPGEKPTLTTEQESALRLLYAEDFALFDAASVT